MANLIQVKIGEYRSTVYIDAREHEFKRDDLVILEEERTTEFGRVVFPGVAKSDQCRKVSSAGRVLRRGNDADRKQIDNNRMKAQDALHVCISKVNEYQLDMKMIQTEYSFDSTKILFYFTSEGRVDFRNLVKELARVLRVRIELKQIGVRDRAKIVEGYGVCGQKTCCSRFIKDFGQLSIKMAKDQALPLNPSKISGVCGRIKCCMAYEHEVYRDFSKGLPKIGSRVGPKAKARSLIWISSSARSSSMWGKARSSRP
jgi:cell fate regulator YaaT (PSP1 superfamily)